MKHVHIFDHQAYHDALNQQIGGGIPVFHGIKQRGDGLGAILGFLGKYAIPIFRNHILPHATTAITNVANDVMNGVPIKTSLKQNAAYVIKNAARSVIDNQSGKGLGNGKLVETVSMVCGVNKKRRPPVEQRKQRRKRKPSKPKGVRSANARRLSKRDIFG